MTILLLPAAVIVPVLSLESHYAPPIQAQTRPDPAQAERVSKYKAALGREVNNAEQTRMRLRCAVAQANAKALADRLATAQQNRNAAYDAILTKLDELVGRLDEQAFEITALQNNVTTLRRKIDSYKKNMNNYQLAVSDMATVDCSADPTAFIAALEAARKSHQAVLPEIPDIRAYITNTIKPSLTQVRGQIQSGQTTGGAQ